jgi:DNA polymerase I
VNQYIKDTTLFALQHGYTVSPYGYRRRVPAVNSDDEGVKAQAIRQAINSTIQNPASVGLLLSICNLQEEIDDKGLPILLLGTCHDAAYCQVTSTDVISARDRLVYHMTQPPVPNCPIPIRAEAEWGKNWAEFSTDFGTALIEEDHEEEDELVEDV